MCAATALHRLPQVEEGIVVIGSIEMLVRGHLRLLLLEHGRHTEGVQRTEPFLSWAEMPSNGDDDEPARCRRARAASQRRDCMTLWQVVTLGRRGRFRWPVAGGAVDRVC